MRYEFGDVIPEHGPFEAGDEVVVATMPRELMLKQFYTRKGYYVGCRASSGHLVLFFTDDDARLIRYAFKGLLALELFNCLEKVPIPDEVSAG